MKWLMIVAALLCVLVVAGMLYVRMAGHDLARWHVDPLKVSQIDPLNQHIEKINVPTDVKTVVAALPDLLGGRLLAGDFGSGWVTVVVRTALIGYPDYVSVRIVEAGPEMTEVTLFSRSRFGIRDFGANKSRIEDILSKLARLPTS